MPKAASKPRSLARTAMNYGQTADARPILRGALRRQEWKGGEEDGGRREARQS